jgi:hypothetical protein
MLDDKTIATRAAAEPCDAWCVKAHDIDGPAEDPVHYSRWEGRVQVSAIPVDVPTSRSGNSSCSLELTVDVQRRFGEGDPYVVVNEPLRNTITDLRLLPQEAARFASALLHGVALTGIPVTVGTDSATTHHD